MLLSLNILVSPSFALSLVPSLLKLQEDTLGFGLVFFFATNNKKMCGNAQATDILRGMDIPWLFNSMKRCIIA